MVDQKREFKESRNRQNNHTIQARYFKGIQIDSNSRKL